MSDLPAVLDRVRDTPLGEIPDQAIDEVVEQLVRSEAPDEVGLVPVAAFSSAI